MSTRIYDAFRFPIVNGEDWWAHALNMRKVVKNEVSAMILQRVLELAVDIHDHRTLGIEFPADINPEFEAHSSAIEFLKKDMAEADNSHTIRPNDFTVECFFVPHKKHIYGKLIVNNGDIRKKLDTMFPEHEEYEYWDHTDEPEHMTRKQWKKRKKTWNKIFGSHDSWAEVGLGWRLDAKSYDSHWMWYENRDTFSFPSLEERAQKISKEIAQNAYLSKRNVDAGNIMGLMRECKKSQEYKDTVAAETTANMLLLDKTLPVWT